MFSIPFPVPPSSSWCVSLCVSACVYTHARSLMRCTHTSIRPPAPCLRLQFYTGGSNYYYNGTHPTEALQHSTVDSQTDFASFKNTYTHIYPCVCICSCLPAFHDCYYLTFLPLIFVFLRERQEGGWKGQAGGVGGRSSPEVSVGCSGLCKSSLCDIKLDEKCEPAVFQCMLCVWTLLCRLRVRGLGTRWAPLFVFLQE